MALRIPHDTTVEAVAEDVPLFIRGREYGYIRQIDLLVIFDAHSEEYRIERAWMASEDATRTEIAKDAVYVDGLGMMPDLGNAYYASLVREFKTHRFQSYLDGLFDDAVLGRMAAA